MKVLDILNAPWALIPAKKVEIDGIYRTHLRGEKINLELVEAAIGKPLNSQPKGYDIREGGVAVLPVDGVIAKRMNLFTRISGGVSSVQVGQDLKDALANPDVKAVVLHIDSPGGAVDGTQELANMIFESRGDKPIVALADGLMASAAYWVGAAADRVLMTSDTTQVGSIGVVATHVDESQAEAKDGYKTTEITAGKFKRIASSYAPLTDEGRASIQDMVDQIYGVFLDSVAKFRGMDSAEQVHTQMADGRLFMGQKAIEAGLVDGVSTLDDLVAELAQDGAILSIPKRMASAVPGPASSATPSTTTTAAGAAAEPETNDKENPMADATIKIDASEAAAAVEAKASELRKEFESKAESLKSEGATAERERIQAVMAQALPGHEALINTLAFDGKTTGPEAAVQVLNAEREKKGKVLGNLKADAPAPLPPSGPEPTKGPSADEDAKNDPEAYAKASWDKDASIRKEFGTLAAYTAFVKAEVGGQIRILGTK